jgi:phosphoglycerol transferase MdoB-like AlkP superfamily enzyme
MRRILQDAIQLSPWAFTWCYAMLMFARSGDLVYILPFTVSLMLAFCISNLAMIHLRSNMAFSVLALLFLVPVVLQVQSIYFSGDLLSPLALSNVDSAKAISIKLSQVVPFAILFLSCVAVSVTKRRKRIDIGPFATSIIVAGWLGLSVQNLTASDLGNPMRLPVLSLALAFHQVALADHGERDPETVAELAKTFERDTTYTDNPEYFELLSTVPSKPNVIVFFVEGMSARLMESYGGKHIGLTPNLDAFRKEAVYADNYYNHTAATLRGLRGQLTSSFIAARENGEDGIGEGDLSSVENLNARSRLVSLPEILNHNGYETMFVTPHADHMNINEIMRGIGFDKVVTGSDVAKAGDIESTPVTDKQLYGYIPTLAAGLKKPFFIGVYNFGTHLFQDSPDLKYRDGHSLVLNRFHNLDAQFGAFFQAFRNSALADNTIIIVTTDHAAFPAPELLDVLDAKPNYFVARIPLMIYWQGVTSTEIDMKGRNSLALSPTILNLLRIKNEKNYFLGCSAFEPDCGPENRITKIDEHLFRTASRSTAYDNQVPATDSMFKTGKQKVKQFLYFSGY